MTEEDEFETRVSMYQLVKSSYKGILSDSQVLHVLTMKRGLTASLDIGVRLFNRWSICPIRTSILTSYSRVVRLRLGFGYSVTGRQTKLSSRPDRLCKLALIGQCCEGDYGLATSDQGADELFKWINVVGKLLHNRLFGKMTQKLKAGI
jgi:hypothetical protein